MVTAALVEYGGLSARCPTARTKGASKSRFRPETPAKPSASLPFFNGRPRLLDPLADAFLVAFDGPTGGLFGLQFMGCNRRQTDDV